MHGVSTRRVDDLVPEDKEKDRCPEKKGTPAPMPRDTPAMTISGTDMSRAARLARSEREAKMATGRLAAVLAVGLTALLLVRGWASQALPDGLERVAPADRLKSGLGVLRLHEVLSTRRRSSSASAPS